MAAPRRRAPPKTKYVEDSKWHISRNIPVALIMALVVQGGGIVWWGSGVTSDIRELKEDVAILSSQTISSKRKLEDFRVTAEKLATVLNHQSETLKDIRTDLKDLAHQLRNDQIRRETRGHTTPRSFLSASPRTTIGR